MPEITQTCDLETCRKDFKVDVFAGSSHFLFIDDDGGRVKKRFCCAEHQRRFESQENRRQKGRVGSQLQAAGD